MIKFSNLYACNRQKKKKWWYSERVLDVEHGSFMVLVLNFATTGEMGKECIRYHYDSQLAELVAAKKGEHYLQPISWIQARTSFAFL